MMRTYGTDATATLRVTGIAHDAKIPRRRGLDGADWKPFGIGREDHAVSGRMLPSYSTIYPRASMLGGIQGGGVVVEVSSGGTLDSHSIPRPHAAVPRSLGMNLWLTVLTAGVGMLFVAISIPLIRRRIPPNGLYGLRVPATFADEWVWYEANACSGRDFLWLGLLLTALTIGLPVLGLGANTYVVWGLIAVVGVIGAVVMGWYRANRLLQEKRRTGAENKTGQ
jgi:hypothetical protein